MPLIDRRAISRRFPALVFAAASVVAGCNGNAEVGEQLAGSWANDGAQLIANENSAVYTTACLTAGFLPITLNADRSFLVHSSAITLMGNVQITRETQLEMSGHFAGDTLHLQVHLINLASGVNDPVIVVLPPGTLNTVPVCTA